MNIFENFKTRCTESEVKRLLGQAPLDVMQDVYSCYNNLYDNCEGQDFIWKKYSAATGVYMFGFLSGCRAIRERKR